MLETIFGSDYVSVALTAAVVATTVVFLGAFVGALLLRAPFRIGAFKRLCVAWVCLLGSSSVWSLSKDVRFSLDQAGTDSFVRFGFLALGLLILFYINYFYRMVSVQEMLSGPLLLLTVFGVWGLGTTLWSVSPAGTAYKSVEYLAMLALFGLSAGLIRTTVSGWEERWKATKNVFDFAWVLVFALIASVYLGILIWPDIGVQRDYRDLSGIVGFSIEGALPGISENAVGQLGALLALVCVVRLIFGSGSRALYVPLLVVSLVTMILTQSRSPVLAFLVGLVVVLVASRSVRLLVLCGIGALLALVSSYGLVAFEFMQRGQNAAELSSLTGRIGYWEASMAHISEQPLAGYGANVGGRFALQSTLGVDVVSTVHNTWIEVLLDTGIVGFVLFVAAVGVVGLMLFGLSPVAEASPVGQLLWVESLGVFALFMARSVFSVNMVWSWNVLFFGVVIVFVCVGSYQRASFGKQETESPPAPQLLQTARRRG